MEEIRISLDTTGNSGEISVLRVDGVIDTMTSSELERIMETLLEQKKFNIIIDLAGVDYISSAGWGIFISNIREIRSNSGDIKLARMVPSVYEIFELLEFDTILHAFESIDRARGDFTISGGNGNGDSKSAVQSLADNTAEAGAQESEVEIKTEEYIPTNSRPLPPTPDLSSTTRESAIGKSDVESEVLALVKADPFYSIGELVGLLNSSGERRASWWKVFNILRRNKLLSRKKRFRHSRRK